MGDTRVNTTNNSMASNGPKSFIYSKFLNKPRPPNLTNGFRPQESLQKQLFFQEPEGSSSEGPSNAPDVMSSSSEGHSNAPDVMSNNASSSVNVTNESSVSRPLNGSTKSGSSLLNGIQMNSSASMTRAGRKEKSRGMQLNGVENPSRLNLVNGRRLNETATSIRGDNAGETSEIQVNGGGNSGLGLINKRRMNDTISSIRAETGETSGLNGPLNGSMRPPSHLVNGRKMNDTVLTIASASAEARQVNPVVVLQDISRNLAGSGVGEVQGLVRDQDGFVMPSRPPPRTSKDLRNLYAKELRKLFNMIADSKPQGNAFYFLKRCADAINSHVDQNLTTNNSVPTVSHDKISVISNWLQSNAKVCSSGEFPLGCSASSVLAEPLAGTLGGGPSSSSFVSGLSAIGSGHRLKPPETTYLIDGWTLVKGSGVYDVFLLGDIYEAPGIKLYERNHMSSKILSADGTFVRSTICLYVLTGNLEDPYDRIPRDVKKHFADSKFPRDWKDIIRLWHALKESGGSSSRPGPSLSSYEEGGGDRRGGGGGVRRALDEETHSGGGGGGEERRDLRECQEWRLREMRRVESTFARMEDEIHDRPRAYNDLDEMPTRERGGEGGPPPAGRDYRRQQQEPDEPGGERDTSSRSSRKRRLNSHYKDYVCFPSPAKKPRREVGIETPSVRRNTSRKHVIKTPACPPGRLSFIASRTRSAARRRLGEPRETPRSSKASRSRMNRVRKTPHPPKRRVIDDDSVSSFNSDL